MQHSKGGNGDAARSTGEVFPLPVILKTGVDGTNNAADVSTSNPLTVGGITTNPTGTFTRPADTTAYAVGDLVANSTTAGSVTPVSTTVARASGGSGMLRRVKLAKSGTSTTNADFRLHAFDGSVTITAANGDNGVFSTNQVANYLGAFDVSVNRAFTDGAAGHGVPVIGSELNFALASGTVIKWLIEARNAYTPANAEVFTITIEDLLN